MVHHTEQVLHTLKELHDNTSSIIEKMNHEDHEVIVTRHGRLIARITPLANIDNLEGVLLSGMPKEEIKSLLGNPDALYTADEIMRMLSDDEEEISRMIDEGSPLGHDDDDE